MNEIYFKTPLRFLKGELVPGNTNKMNTKSGISTLETTGQNHIIVINFKENVMFLGVLIIVPIIPSKHIVLKMPGLIVD